MRNGILITFVYLFVALVNQRGGAQAQHSSSDLPPPPTKPERFTSKQQLKEYLVKLHEYYAIIGRPRFGRSYSMEPTESAPAAAQSSDAEEVFQESISNENMADLIPNAFKSTENSISLIFELLDSDKDGLITKSEFLRFFKNLGKQN